MKIGDVTRGTQASKDATKEKTLPNSSAGVTFEIKDLMTIDGACNIDLYMHYVSIEIEYIHDIVT